VRSGLVLLALGCACSSSKPPEITGTLSFGGKAVTSMACRPGAAVHIFVDIVTNEGTLRLEDKQLSLGGEPLACDKLDRSWGGGRRPDKTAYWRGTLAFSCRGEAGSEIIGDLVLDCGNITAEERKQLDGQRKDLREEQRKPSAGSGSGSGS
jgi:hypothetical protein